MQLVLNEDQELLAKTAQDFVRERSPVSRVRELRDKKDSLGFSPPLWKEMAELGWVGILVPEPHGGAGMGMSDLAVVMEALGRNLVPEPILSTVLLAAVSSPTPLPTHNKANGCRRSPRASALRHWPIKRRGAATTSTA